MTVTLAAPPAAPTCPIGHDLPFHFCSVCRCPVRPADLTWVNYLPRHRDDCDPARSAARLFTATEAEA